MKVEIEDYRDWTIYFDTIEERFYSVSQRDDTSKENRSYSAAKKAIDDYLRDNQEFKPFKAMHKSHLEIIDIVGIRKDGRYITERNGKKEQLSSYDEDRWIVWDDAYIPVVAEIRRLQNEQRKKEDEFGDLINLERIKFNTKPLSQIEKPSL
jgi:hypothetical protein